MLTHDQIVQKAVAEMLRQDVKGIKADHIPTYPKPDQIGQFIPDVTGYFHNSLVVIEAETTDGLSAQHTAEQFTTFYRSVNSRNGYFIVAVAKADEHIARKLISSSCDDTKIVKIWVF